ncbi:hypothetical protein [Pontibacter virosus]|uniref:Uncharacterized protein n=1 Tax=Pontibacter virosus TaxID=1765052 RepID=A0A2U1B2U4_9BACT|nr:hypothetical protein [Pontibacter virosus]PVY42999.1 hypothetical protein C8E01_102175 [Pontibacter virosus]
MFRSFFRGGRLTGPGQLVFTFLFSALSYHFIAESPEPPAGFRDWAIFSGFALVALSVIFFHIVGWRYERHIKRYLIERILLVSLLASAMLYLTAASWHLYQIS